MPYFTVRTDSEVAERNLEGMWIPSIPLPLFSLGHVCLECHKRFWTMNNYRGHYALVHILKMEDS